MLSTKLALIALAVAAGLTAGIPTSADYLTGPDTEFIEPSPADVTKPAELSQFLGSEPGTDVAADGPATARSPERAPKLSMSSDLPMTGVDKALRTPPEELVPEFIQSRSQAAGFWHWLGHLAKHVAKKVLGGAAEEGIKDLAESPAGQEVKKVAAKIGIPPATVDQLTKEAETAVHGLLRSPEKDAGAKAPSSEPSAADLAKKVLGGAAEEGIKDLAESPAGQEVKKVAAKIGIPPATVDQLTKEAETAVHGLVDGSKPNAQVQSPPTVTWASGV